MEWVTYRIPGDTPYEAWGYARMLAKDDGFSPVLAIIPHSEMGGRLVRRASCRAKLLEWRSLPKVTWKEAA
jgi:hypothetical protein